MRHSQRDSDFILFVLPDDNTNLAVMAAQTSEHGSLVSSLVAWRMTHHGL